MRAPWSTQADLILDIMTPYSPYGKSRKYHRIIIVAAMGRRWAAMKIANSAKVIYAKRNRSYRQKLASSSPANSETTSKKQSSQQTFYLESE